jgi:hypothetical protein
LLTRFYSTAALCIVAAVASSCERRPRDGRYELVYVDRKPVPETLTYQNNCVIVMMSGYVEVEKQTFISHYQIDRNCADGTHHLPDPGTPGKFVVQSSNLTFTDGRGVTTGHGSFRGDTLTVQGPLHELRFIRKMQ